LQQTCPIRSWNARVTRFIGVFLCHSWSLEVYNSLGKAQLICFVTCCHMLSVLLNTSFKFPSAQYPKGPKSNVIFFWWCNPHLYRLNPTFGESNPHCFYGRIRSNLFFHGELHDLIWLVVWNMAGLWLSIYWE
jgi:hypothetical protein